MRNGGEGLSTDNKWAIIGIALLQGLLLFALHDSLELQILWLYPAYTLLLALPLLAIVCIGPRMSPWFYGALAVYGLLLISLGLYRGQQCSPADSVRCIPFAYVLCLTIATFVLAVFLRACAASWDVPATWRCRNCTAHGRPATRSWPSGSTSFSRKVLCPRNPGRNPPSTGCR